MPRGSRPPAAPRRVGGARRFGSRRVPVSLAGRAGAVLLEAMVALVILSVAGVAAVAMAAQAADAVRRAREADAEMRRASAFLHAVALWPREDLDRRLGERPQGPWKLRVQRPAPTLYEVVLVDSSATREILRTSLFRPEPAAPEWAPAGDETVGEAVPAGAAGAP